jgi:hypothetical protein
LYQKAPRRYQIKAENAKIGIADIAIEHNSVMEVPALVFAARRGIDVLDWCVVSATCCDRFIAACYFAAR